MKTLSFLLSFFAINLYAQQNSFPKIISLDKRATLSQVIELKNKNYLCIVSSTFGTPVRNKTKLVILSLKGTAIDSIVFSAPNKDLNIYKAVETSYGLCLMGVMKQDTNNLFWVVNLNKQLQILNEQFKPLLSGEVWNLVHSVDVDSTIVVMFKYTWITQVLTSFGKINKKGDIMLLKNITGSAGKGYANGIVIRKDSLKYNLLYYDGYWVCDTSFSNWHSHDINLPTAIISPYISEVLIKNDTTFLCAGETYKSSFKTNPFFSVVKNYRYTNYKITALGGDTTYYIALRKCIDTTKNGQFIYVGGTYDAQSSILDIKNSYLRLTKLDNNYNTVWTKDFGGDANYLVYGVTATSDGGCIMYASRHNHNPFQQVDVIVIKVDENGVITSTTSIPMPQQAITAYPNPSNGQLNFKKEDPSVSNRFDVNIFDMSGKLVFQKRETDLTETFDLSHLSEGNYMYQITSENAIVAVGKWVKIKN